MLRGDKIPLLLPARVMHIPFPLVPHGDKMIKFKICVFLCFWSL